jgi:hypothetical protein
MALVAESCTNNAIDPGEPVTVLFSFRNTGLRDTTDLVVTLLSANGVAASSGPQNYGILVAGGAPESQSFTFTGTGTCGDQVSAMFQLQDGPLNLGVVSVPIRLGIVDIVMAEDFDNASVPNLPPDWSSTAAGAQDPWQTTSVFPDTGIHAAFSPDPPDIGLNELTTPSLALPSIRARLSFRNSYDLEPGDVAGIANDGGVLEIQVGTNAFTDIIAAGGSFVSGGYTSTITNLWGNPLAGRQAWSGNSGGYITTVIDMPPAAADQTVRFRWRCGTDNGNSISSLAGWRIDTVRLVTTQCCTGTP